MINDFLKNKQLVKEYQILKAWREFYLECGNEYEAMKLGYKISRYENIYFE